MTKPLVVLVPDHRGAPSALAPLKELLIREAELADAFWIEFDYIEPYYSNKSPETIALTLSATIDSFVRDHDGEVGYIILAGHSMGSALMRRAFLDASGFGESELLSHTWAELVNRIVLMGGFGSGFRISDQKPHMRIWLGPLVWVAHMFHFGKMRLEMLAGADFISRLRVDWIKFNGTVRKQPPVIHLLGSNDFAVRPKDVIELEQFPNSVPITVPNATHGNIATPTPNTEAQLRRAFVGDATANRSVEIKDAGDKVFFLLHGIRDSRECFESVKQALKQRCPSAKIIMPDYGYLSAREFLNNRYRNSFVPWFIEQFGEYLARNPQAEFYCAGHSNGTYILGEALRRIPRVAFTRVYLAASVLPQEFEWDLIVGHRRQVDVVRSDMGSEDWPVGVLCRTLHRIGVKSVGPGGFDGFNYGDTDHIAHNRFSGGHGAMLTDENAASIVEFLLTGSSADVKHEQRTKSKWFEFCAKFGDILLPLTLGIGCLFVAGLSLLPMFWPASGLLGPACALIFVVAVWIWLGRF